MHIEKPEVQLQCRTNPSVKKPGPNGLCLLVWLLYIHYISLPHFHPKPIWRPPTHPSGCRKYAWHAACIVPWLKMPSWLSLISAITFLIPPPFRLDSISSYQHFLLSTCFQFCIYSPNWQRNNRLGLNSYHWVFNVPSQSLTPFGAILVFVEIPHCQTVLLNLGLVGKQQDCLVQASMLRSCFISQPMNSNPHQRIDMYIHPAISVINLKM